MPFVISQSTNFLKSRAGERNKGWTSLFSGMFTDRLQILITVRKHWQSKFLYNMGPLNQTKTSFNTFRSGMFFILVLPTPTQPFVYAFSELIHS